MLSFVLGFFERKGRNLPRKPLTLPEVADKLGVHYMTVYRYVRTGRLPAKRVRGVWQVDPADLAHVERSRQGTRATGKAPSRAGRNTGSWPATRPGRGTSSKRHSLRAWSRRKCSWISSARLDSIGTLWEQGKLSVTEEHRASSVAARLIGRLGAALPVEDTGGERWSLLPHLASCTLCLSPSRPTCCVGRIRASNFARTRRRRSSGDGGGQTRSRSRRHRLHRGRVAPGGTPGHTVLRQTSPHVPVFIGGAAITGAAHAGPSGRRRVYRHAGQKRWFAPWRPSSLRSPAAEAARTVRETGLPGCTGSYRPRQDGLASRTCTSLTWRSRNAASQYAR